MELLNVLVKRPRQQLQRQQVTYNQPAEVLQRYNNNYNIKKLLHISILQLEFFSKLGDPINWLSVAGISGLFIYLSSPPAYHGYMYKNKGTSELYHIERCTGPIVITEKNIQAKMNMEHSTIQLTDLPDEILIIIFKKLYDVEILYSLIGVNKQLNKIIHDSIFTRVLTLLNYRLDGSICSLPYPMLDRFCSKILPEIDHKIEELNLESSSMGRILLATNYPNLHRLSFYGLNIERAKYLFTDKSLIFRFKNQIRSLIVNFTKSNEQGTGPMIRLIFLVICDMFTNLEYLNFDSSSSLRQQLSFVHSPPTVFPSTLLELHVNLQDFIDCLYLLDGRFNQLETLYVHITFITLLHYKINDKEKLPNLKCFSLHSDIDLDTDNYDDLVVPLLHRMVNLEKLDLQLNCERETFVNGDDLKRNIINNLLRLNTFTFNIRSTSYCNNQSSLPSNEDIKKTLKDLKSNKVICCVDCFPKSLYSQCHIYSYPYKSRYYYKITNNFPGGLFQYVNIVSLFDERPFEHEFFHRIAQSFPFMKRLTVINDKPQKNKKSENDNENFSIIEYHHLTELCLIEAHEDYVEEFLLDRKTCLPNGVHLQIDYELFEKVKHYFQRDATRINSSKINICL
ncbi:unnamed protein product [Rotaria sordida]|uniref:F-box domain-containing protein n=1 Tax=Rotaria sordida TaxID=392033 RepID=A0A819HVS7_9BILA|nr:unnamed protein product [Rotaria sordida]CAF3906445.1 unnamed protein product [Rotaria sordida]